MLFTSPVHAQAGLADWKDDDNTTRPHSAIGNLAPATYAILNASGMQREGGMSYLEAPCPVPLRHQAKPA
jgi:putative transposase